MPANGNSQVVLAGVLSRVATVLRDYAAKVQCVRSAKMQCVALHIRLGHGRRAEPGKNRNSSVQWPAVIHHLDFIGVV